MSHVVHQDRLLVGWETQRFNDKLFVAVEAQIPSIFLNIVQGNICHVYLSVINNGLIGLIVMQ